MEKKYVVGIDFGHGETSAAYCEIPLEGNQNHNMGDVKDIDILGKGKTIPSAIFIPDNQDAPKKIGDNAFSRENVGKGKIWVGFKHMPIEPPVNEDADRVMCDFMKAVFIAIQNLTDDVPFHSNDFYLYIAKPSSWGEDAKSAFYRLVKSKAGLPVEDISAIINESRAAFIQAQHDEKVKITGQKIYDGTVVIDMGSSTVDMTYLSDDKDVVLKDHGYACGASIIEEAMLEDALQDGELKTILENNPKYKDPLLYELRKLKEDFFSKSKPIWRTIRYADILSPSEKGYKTIKLNEEKINQYTNDYQKNFREGLRDYLLFLQKELNKVPVIYYVILTGGASRMDFARTIIQEEWKLDVDTQIYQVDDPSLTVSRGVANVARMDILTKGEKKEIEILRDELLKQNKIYPSYDKRLREHLTKKCEEIIEDNLKNGSLCLNQLFKNQSYVNDLLTGVFYSIENDCSKILDEIIKENSKEIEKRVDKVIEYYSVLGIESFTSRKLDKLYSQWNLKKTAEKHMEKWGKINFANLIDRHIISKIPFLQKKHTRKRLKALCEVMIDKYASRYQENYINSIVGEYINNLIKNIDRVRKEITEND